MGKQGGRERSLTGLVPYLVALTAVLLCFPCINYPFLFDDYDFLQRVQHFRPRFLLPDPTLIFYRPVSRECYFGLIQSLAPGNPLLGHLLNTALVAIAVVLTFKLATRLAGHRAGIIAALLVALFGQWPVLVGWVSGAQDLLAIVFTLAALLLAVGGGVKVSILCFVLAILSKETAVAAVPALIATQLLRPRESGRALLMAITLGLVVGAWALIHPGLNILFHKGVSSEGDYIGLHNPGRWHALAQSAISMANMPLRTAPWPTSLNWWVLLSVAPLVASLVVLGRTQSATDDITPVASRKVVMFGALVAVPPLILTTILVQRWFPYYACFPAAGVAIILGCWLSSKGKGVVISVVLAYLMLGVWSRGVEPKHETNERTLGPAAHALPQVERNFKELVPIFPAGAMVYVTTMARGAESVYLHLHRFQALRVWYDEPDIQTLRPELYVIGSRPEFLFIVAPDLNVAQINPETLEVRAAKGPIKPDYIRSALRSFAIGLSGVDETERAVHVLLSLDPQNQPMAIVNRRIAAMLLLSRGETPAAVQLLQGVPELPVADAIQNVGVLLTVPTRDVALEEHAMKAFGLSPSDPTVLKALLGGLMTLGYYVPAERIANRLLVVSPGEPQALEALKRLRESASEGDRAAQETKVLGTPAP